MSVLNKCFEGTVSCSLHRDGPSPRRPHARARLVPAPSPRLHTLEVHTQQSCPVTLSSSPMAPEGWGASSQGWGFLAQEVGQPHRPDAPASAQWPGQGTGTLPAGSGSGAEAGGDRRASQQPAGRACCLSVRKAAPSLRPGVWHHGTHTPCMRGLRRSSVPWRTLKTTCQIASEPRKHSAVCLRKAVSRRPACLPGTEGA